MSKFIKLSEGLFLIGEGGVNRIEPLALEYGFGEVRESVFKTVLYSNTIKITTVKETIEEIEKLLDIDQVRGDN